MGPYPTVNYGAGYYPQQLDLAAVMRQVYLWLAMGLTVGFGVAFALGHQVEVAKASCASPSCDLAQYSIVFNPAVVIISLIAYLVLGFTLRPIIRRASIPLAATLYIVFTAIFGFMVSSYFAIYDTGTIFAAFGVTAGMFAFMCLIGYTTRVDLSKLGAIFLMALIGLILASVVNFFVQSAALYWIVTYAGVVIFCGLTAYDTQAIRKMATAAATSGSPDSTARVALYGAFRLFLDFINLFLFILRILGGRGGSRR
jgi:uncharacterized protein